MSIVRDDNERLRKQLTELRAARESRHNMAHLVKKAPKKVVRTDRRRVPGRHVHWPYTDIYLEVINSSVLRVSGPRHIVLTPFQMGSFSLGRAILFQLRA